MLDAVGTAIACGELPPGSVLRLEELQQSYGASRTVAREVVRALEAMRLTTSKRRVGVTVRDCADWNHYDPRLIRWQLDSEQRPIALRNLMELRWAVEPSAARFAAIRATPEERGRLRALGARLEVTAHARDLHTFLGHDIDFHHLVLAASGNPMFTQLSEVVAEVLTGRTEHGLMPPEPQPEAVALHLEVAHAIDSADADRAERAMRDIMVQARDEVASQFQ
ncbi:MULTISPECIES: FadR/GntR family transcriptional regulator [Amycolatopsis]|uniref:FCD domain-containing protein n=1 Tax=Amycolatopsis thermalba TaxID=944492 RepID=A0ABY4P6L0_9PSEU|nr:MULTISPECIES: FCD domain-containing protein [Amycolatopsis]OXM68353.1 GntR family transcriptional regulator [Amycolatopsis sp. KNN50.9b]UQS27803.1 FCD domain-containing protein [Amycolatopsis thermalba]